MILIAYDGSADAQAAIDRVALLMPGVEATVLTVWEPFAVVMAGAWSVGVGMGMASADDDVQRIDAASREAALASAAEGAARATAAGLAGRPRCETREGDVATTILRVAATVDADVIVLGTRGLSSVKSFLLGSVSHAVVQRADRAVLVIPAAVLAGRRHGAISATRS